MANYLATSRTNYFRVTDEDKYAELFNHLVSEDFIEDFTEERDGVLYHGFGTYGSIDYKAAEENDSDFDTFLKEIQTILPEDEAFIYTEVGHEKLRCVTGVSIVYTNTELKSMSLSSWALNQAKQILGEDFSTQMDF